MWHAERSHSLLAWQDLAAVRRVGRLFVPLRGLSWTYPLSQPVHVNLFRLRSYHVRRGDQTSVGRTHCQRVSGSVREKPNKQLHGEPPFTVFCH